MAFARIGDEFLVNTTTGGAGQTAPAITYLAGGGYVITWTDGSNYDPDVRGQIFDASGQKVGDEFLINTFASEPQEAPAITALAGGGFVVTWYTRFTDFGQPRYDSEHAIGAQVFDADGGKVGAEFIVNSTTPGNQHDPAITALAGGGFVVVWTNGVGVVSLNAQLYSSSGAPVSGELVLTTPSEGLQPRPAIASLADGGFVVTWVNGTGYDTVQQGDVFAQTYNADGTARGEAFLVNTATDKGQGDPAVIGLASGGFVVTWYDYSIYGYYAEKSDIKAQVFDSDGQKFCSEFLVNTTTIKEQLAPSITSLADGSFVVSWTDYSTDDDYYTGSNIKAQAFNPDGTKSGVEFVVSSSTSLDQHDPAITGLPGGGFVVSWVDNTFVPPGGYYTQPAIKAQVYGEGPIRISSGGGGETASFEAPENQKAVTTVKADYIPIGGTVTYAIFGGSDASLFAIDEQTGVLTFKDAPDFETPGDSGGNGIYDVTVSVSDGTVTDTQAISVTVTDRPEPPTDLTPLGGELPIKTAQYNQEYGPAVQGLGNGRFVVTWTDDAYGFDDSGYGVKAQIYNADGSKSGAEFVVNTNVIANQDTPTITELADGNFVISWQSYSFTDYRYHLKAQIFSENGAKIGTEFSVETQLQLDQAIPSIAALVDGGFVVTWRAYGTGPGVSLYDIRAQVFDAAGTKVGAEFIANTAIDDYQLDPKVAGLAGGGFVIVWQGYDYGSNSDDIKGQYFDADGNKVGVEFHVNTDKTGSQNNPSVTALANGGFIATWTSTNPTNANADVKAQIFAADGSLIGAEFLVNTTTDESQSLPVVTTLADGRFVISWADNSHTDVDKSFGAIKAQVFSAAGVKLGGEFEVNTTTIGEQSYPAITAMADGGFAIAWQETDYATYNQNVRAQVYAASAAAAPVIDSDGGGDTAALAIAEGVKAVTTVHATASGTAAYSITGGADAALFDIDASTGALSFKAKPDFEAPGDAGADNVYNVTVTATDGALTDSQQLEVTVSNVNEPPVITSDGGGDQASISVSENGTSVTTVTATDPELESVTYAIAGGTDRLRFNIDAATGALSFKAAPDFEGPIDANGDNVYSVLVSATDSSNNTGYQLLSITVTNVNEAPVITSNGGGTSASVSISENTTAVTKVTATDPDAGATQTYSISGGADAAKFQIDAATGALSFKAVPNFESPADAGGDNVYNVTVSVSDGTLTGTQAIAVTVTDVAEGPAFTSLGKLGGETYVNTNNAGRQHSPSIAGLEGGGYVVVWTDLDSKTLGDTSYAIKAQLYTADGTAVGGEFLVNTATSGNQYDPTVTALKGGGFAVTWTGPSNDGSDVLGQVFNATGGKVGSEFTVNPATPPYSSQYAPTITGLTGGGFVVTWWDADSGTGGDSIDSIKAQLYAADGTKVGGEFRVNSVTAGSQFEPSIASLADGGFVVTWISDEGTPLATRDLLIRAQVYNAAGTKVGSEFIVNTVDGGFQQKAEVTGLPDGHFVVVWEDESGVGGDNSRSGIKAQLFEADGTKIGGEFLVNTFTSDYQRLPKVASLANGDFVVTWNTWNDGNASSVSAQVFRADGSKVGTEFTVNTSTTFTQQNPAVTGLANGTFAVAWQDDSITATDFARSFDIRVQLFGNNTAPVIDSNAGGATASIAVGENGTAVTTVHADDGETPSAITYSISGGGDAAKFDIDAATGALTFKTAPNFEAPSDSGANNVYDVIVKASDGSLFDTQAIAVTVTNVNEAPSITSNGGGATGTISLAENGTGVTTVQAGDPDAGASLSYSITGGADRTKFTIDAATGALSFKAAPDYETPGDAGGNNVYDVTVTASDGSLTDSQDLAITITDANDAPVISTNGGGATASITLQENRTTVTTVDAGDQDPGTTLVYSLAGGADESKFDIDEATGALTFKSAPNFDVPGDAGSNNVYDVIVRASDGTLSDTQAIAVTITNVNEAPVITSNGGSPSGTVSIGENGTSVTTVAATDPDAGATLTYAITGGLDAALFEIDEETGALSFKDAPNFEAPGDSNVNNIYDVTVTASDGTLSDTQSLKVTVTNVNEAPTITSNGGGASASLIVDEKVPFITKVVATDPDAATSFVYSIHGGADAALFNIDAATGQLTFRTRPNVETPADAGADNVYDVVVKASDGSLVDTQALSIEVWRIINGTPVSDTINGTAGGDHIFGLASDDVITGLGGHDVIDGGAGGDRMTGGLGNDTYIVDDSRDAVIEAAAEGTDSVLASIKVFRLDATVENLTFTSGGAHSGVGNAFANTITGNSGADNLSGKSGDDRLYGLEGSDVLAGDNGNDLLDGGAGADKMAGGAGDDIFIVDNVGDRVSEATRKGNDTVYSSVTYKLSANVETLILTGTDAIDATSGNTASRLQGNSAANTLNGRGGNDTLVGGLGNDTLIGGKGADKFVFDSLPNGSANVDLIRDFSRSEGDQMQLSKAVFGGLGALGTLTAGAFLASASATAALDADDRIVYNTSTGALLYDADGLGGVAAVQIATLGTTTHPALAFSDFQIIA